MEIKPRYQYTYFIYPYIIEKSKYTKYILKTLNNKHFRHRIFQKERDYDINKYFLPRIKNYMFSSFQYDTPKRRMVEEIKKESKAALLAKEPCVIFEYNIKRDIQGKIQEKQGIFFRIEKIELICFNTGICFLSIKTNVEDIEDFSNILNFNYKFRDITEEHGRLNNYDKIRVQTSAFKDIETFKDFIQEITGTNYEAHKLDIDTERFLTYSYVCIEQEAWNNNTNFEDLNTIFTKYINILPNDNSVNYEEEKATIISKWKYAKIGITKQGVALFSSTSDMNNYTKLPQEYETTYLYTYIFTLYKKIYLKRISERFIKQRIHRIHKKTMGTRNNSRRNGNSILPRVKKSPRIRRALLQNKIQIRYTIQRT